MNNDELIFEEDEFDVQEEPVQEEPKPEVESDYDLTEEVLRLKGITDMNKIKFEDVSGAVVERPWDSLSREEQLNILTQQEEEYDLDEDEIQLINMIRQSGGSVQDYLDSLQVPAEPKYNIDELSDDEVYVLDLLDKVGSDNITDEEITEHLENAKKNEKIFSMKVEGLRKEYKKLQEDEEARVAEQMNLKKQEEYNQFANSIINEIKGLNSFAGNDLELSQEDSENLANYMLVLDENGVSEFGKALQDPKNFTEAAFWLLNKDQIVEELTKQIQEGYKRGFAAGKGTTSSLAIKPKQQKSQDSDEFLIDDIDW